MPNVSSVTDNFFPTAYENTVPMTLTSTITAGATTVAVTGATNYTNGEVVCWTIDPTTPSLKQVFTGVWNSGSSEVTNVVWTEVPTGGSNVGHSAGATIIDYVSATHWDIAMKGILSFATQAGGLQTSAVQAALNISNLAANGWNNLGYTTTYGSNNGNKEFTVTCTGNLTTVLSPGMKMNFTRGTTPPTECMAFSSASSQYASISSPSGITFTSAFTCEAWVYLLSYPASGQPAGIISRSDNSTGGWQFLISNVTGGPEVAYASSSNFTSAVSYQAIPLNQWVHVAAVVSSVSGKTMSIYINGTLVPSYVNQNSSTALTQTGNLEIGAVATVSNSYLNGYVSEARVWSVAQTQANIQANMAINLTTATNLVACYQGNGAWTDSSGNSNTLTAEGGAINNQANNPFNAIEYGVITKVSYSNPTTTITLFTGNSNTIPNQTLSSPQYSVVKAPYGFPTGRDNWTLVLTLLSQVDTSGTSPNTIYNPGGVYIAIPTGSWNLTGQLMPYVASSSSIVNMAAGLSTSSSAFILGSNLAAQQTNQYSNSAPNIYTLLVRANINLSALTNYYLLIVSSAYFSTLAFGGNTSTEYPDQTTILAECGYI